MQTLDLEQIYNRYIRAARKAAKGKHGMERAKAIYEYFLNETDHPHAQFTYEQQMANRITQFQFPIALMQTMASLCAENDCLAN